MVQVEDDRLTLRIARPYAEAIGIAVFAFARLEWTAVQCCQALEPGSIEALSDRTAGRVADTLKHLARSLPESPRRARLLEQADAFQAYTRTRNNLLHARPGTDAAGDACLYRDGDAWTLSELHAVANAFVACGTRLEALLAELPLIQPD